MPEIYLGSSSLDYMLSQGVTDTSNRDRRREVFDSALTKLADTLESGSDLQPGTVDYIIDYCDEELTRGDPQTKAVLDKLVNPEGSVFSQWENRANSDNDPNILTPELTKFLGSVRFFSHGQVEINMDRGLGSLQRQGQPLNPEAVAALGEVSQWGRHLANLRVRDYLDEIAVTRLPLDDALVSAYMSFNDTSPTGGVSKALGEIIRDKMASDGSINPYLMALYKQISPTGPTDIAQGGYETWSYSMEPMPTVGGWAVAAMNSLIRGARAGKPMDKTMLSELEAASPWCANYVRWESLKTQASKNQKLDVAYLKSLAEFRPNVAKQLCTDVLNAQIAKRQGIDVDCLSVLAQLDPGQAEAICEKEFADALQPTNRVVSNYFNEPGKPLKVKQDELTIRVDLKGMGGRPPVAGDVLYLMSGTSEKMSYTLTATDVAFGYAELKPALEAGVATVRTRYASADGQYASPLSLALSLNVVPAGAPIPISATAYKNGVLLQFSTEGFPLDSTVDYLRLSYAKESATLTTNNSVVIDANARTVWIPERMFGEWFAEEYVKTVIYNNQVADPSGIGSPLGKRITDTAGDLLPPIDLSNWAADYWVIPVKTISASNYVSNPSTFQNPAPLEARPVSEAALNVLERIDPVKAQQWRAAFDAVKGTGLVQTGSGSTPPTTEDDEGGKGLENDMVSTLLSRYTSLQNQAWQMVGQIDTRTKRINDLNTLYTKLNDLMLSMPENVSMTDPVKDRAGANYGTMLAAVNSAIKSTGYQAFTSAGGLMTSTATKADLSKAIQGLKTSIDNLSNLTQPDTIFLQQLMTRMNEMMTMLSNFIEKISRGKDTIIANMRGS